MISNIVPYPYVEVLEYGKTKINEIKKAKNKNKNQLGRAKH